MEREECIRIGRYTGLGKNAVFARGKATLENDGISMKRPTSSVDIPLREFDCLFHGTGNKRRAANLAFYILGEHKRGEQLLVSLHGQEPQTDGIIKQSAPVTRCSRKEGVLGFQWLGGEYTDYFRGFGERNARERIELISLKNTKEPFLAWQACGNVEDVGRPSPHDETRRIPNENHIGGRFAASFEFLLPTVAVEQAGSLLDIDSSIVRDDGI